MDCLRGFVLCALTLLGGIAAAQEAGRFEIDAGQSDVHWRVYKAGAFARFGHNHVISVSEMTGSVQLAVNPAESEWEITLPVAALIVDDPALREGYGEDFSSEPSDKDIEGTRENMLSERVLNGEAYTEIHIKGTGVSGALDDAEFPVVIEMLGRSIDLVLPGSVSVDGDTLTVSGEFSLQHSDLGMEPFSVMMGAR
jgi:polyisoprenoid-binding protein YceI